MGDEDEDEDAKLVRELAAKAELPRPQLVAYLRERDVSNQQVVSAACELPEEQQQALCLALLELRPTLPEAVDGTSGNERYSLAWAVNAAACGAVDAGDPAGAERIVAPYLGVTAEFPFLARAAALTFAALGRADEALAQVRIAVNNGAQDWGELETDERLAPLNDRPDFKQMFADQHRSLREAMWRGWPAGVPVPPRLRELAAYAYYPSYHTIGDFELDCQAEDFLVHQYKGDLSDLMAELQGRLPVFAKDGSGGRLMFWMREAEPGRWPVIWWGSEGRIEAVGESLDDFLALVAGSWTETGDSTLHGDDALKAWAAGAGIQPHPDSDRRFEDLRALTLEFLRWFGEQYRSGTTRLHPERALLVEVVPGISVGAVRLGAPKAEVDATLGTPELASWQEPDAPTFTAFYGQGLYTVDYVRPAETVAEVTIYTEWIRVRFPDGFEPMLARREEVEAWLRGQNQAYEIDWAELTCPGLGLKLNLDRSRVGEIAWVEQLALAPPRSIDPGPA